MDMEIIQNWKHNVHFLMEKYNLKNIFNLDKTGLFWLGQPTKTLTFKEDQAKCGKMAKEHLTVSFVTSAIGDQYKPMMFGRRKKPQAFKKNCNLEYQLEGK